MRRHPYVLVALLLASCGHGGPVTEAGETPAAVSARDRAWLEEVHEAGFEQIRSGGLAEKKGGSLAIRRAGTMLVAEHTKLDADVLRVAARVGVDLPRTIRGGRVDIARRLAEETGGRFDRDFVRWAVAGHRKTIADTEAEVRDGTAPAVTDLARTLLPVLRAHLAMLRKASPDA